MSGFLCAGFKAQQYRRKVRLYLEDTGLWSREDGWNDLHDDPLRRHKVLQSAGGHTRDGLQGKR